MLVNPNSIGVGCTDLIATGDISDREFMLPMCRCVKQFTLTYPKR